MSVRKDTFFASVEEIEQRNFCLDLYLPPNNRDTEYYDQGVKVPKRFEDIYEHEEYSSPQKLINRYSAEDGWLCESRYVDDRAAPSSAGRTDDGAGINPFGKPFVIFVHGGGWRRGAREAWRHYLYYDVNFFVALCLFLFGTYGNIGEALAEKGVGCAVISYPLTEASLGYICVEMVLSYLQSCLMVLPVVCASSYLLPVWRQDSHQFPVINIADVVFLATLVTNTLTLMIMCIKRREMKINLVYLRIYLIVVAVILIALSHCSEHNGFTKCVIILTTFLMNQSFILNRRLSRCRTTFKHQLHVVAQAVSWAKNLARDRPEVDPGRIFLMGHSAGGHLASLITLDKRHLNNVGCSPGDLKGVISLSGVYCLQTLTGRLLKPLYLAPAFGHCPETWLRASPSHLLRTTKDRTGRDCCRTISSDECCQTGVNFTNTTDNIQYDQCRTHEKSTVRVCCRIKDDVTCCEKYTEAQVWRSFPPFLLMVAESDSILKDQSIEFYQLLSDVGVKTVHLEVKGSNHFSIVTGIENEKRKGTGSVLSHVTSFIHCC